MTWVIVAAAVWGIVSLLSTLVLARRLGCAPYGPSSLGAGFVLEAGISTTINKP